MAHIFKKPTKDNKGIIVLTHKEKDIGQQLYDRYKDSYFFGTHYGGHHVRVDKLPYQDFYMGTPSVAPFVGEEPFRIPFSSRGFSPAYYRERAEVHKEWDILNISRNTNCKNLPLFLFAIRRLYDEGHKLKVLLVVPSCMSESKTNHFLELVEVYKKMFSTEEREYFTLLRLSSELGFLGISPRTIAYFYQSSKVFTLLSAAEGASRVVHEALLCGLPVVCYKGIQGGSADYLDETNSVCFNNENDVHTSLLKAVEQHDTLNTNSELLAEELREDKTLPKLKEYFKQLYTMHGQEFDGELINTNRLNHRLPGHYLDVPWTGLPTADIKTPEQLEAFCRELE